MDVCGSTLQASETRKTEVTGIPLNCFRLSLSAIWLFRACLSVGYSDSPSALFAHIGSMPQAALIYRTINSDQFSEA
jgi:hypothetical protein